MISHNIWNTRLHITSVMSNQTWLHSTNLITRLSTIILIYSDVLAVSIDDMSRIFFKDLGVVVHEVLIACLYKTSLKASTGNKLSTSRDRLQHCLALFNDSTPKCRIIVLNIVQYSSQLCFKHGFPLFLPKTTKDVIWKSFMKIYSLKCKSR
jgi:hypothetical protein